MAPIELKTRHGIRAALSGIDTMTDLAHAGLWIDRYLSVLHPETEEDKEAIRNLLGRAADSKIPDGYPRAFKDREERLKGLSGSVEGGVTKFWTAKVSGRMVIGLGTEALAETGIELEHTWGVPMIPGSAMKGLAASTAHRYGGPAWYQASPDHDAGEDARLMFGNTESAGYVIFHDAWWNPEGQQKLPLDLDIMTVHHSAYYGDGTAPPSDTDEPNPVSFLTAHGTYLVALSGPRTWVERAAEWLELGLREEGIGGKTAAGYGRMVLTEHRDPKEVECIRKLQNIAAQFKGASTAKTLITRLKAARDEGCDPRIVETSGNELYEKNPSFWKDWLKKQSEEEREILRSLGLYAKETKPQTGIEEESKTLRQSDGVAWTISKKGKATVYVQLSQTITLKRRIDKIQSLDSVTTNILKNADSKAVGVAVVCEFSVDGSQKTLRTIKLK